MPNADNLRGDGPYTHGNSFACGSPVTRDWQLQAALKTSTNCWEFME